MKLKKVLALVLSAALVVSAFAGCGGNSSKTSTESIAASESSAESTESTASGDSTPAASGDATATFTPKTVDAAKTISLNAGMEPTGLNTLTSTYSIEFALFKHMYENLVTLDDDDNTAPGAAESWDYDEDTLTYTFHLRKDGVWTNGDPVTAKDFEFAWSQALNPDVASDYAYFLYFIKNAEKLVYLKKYPVAIIGGILAGMFACLGGVLVLSMAFGLDHTQYVTLLPKSITTAIGMGLSEELGGMVSVTVASIIVTGLFGNVAAAAIFKLFRIKHPVAIGVSCGTGAHAMGTSRAREFGEIEEAMSGLSIAVCGLLTVVGASIFAMIRF